jgi:hypothetical protein
MIFPYEKGWRNRMEPNNGRQTENGNAKIKKWCKFTRGIKAKRRKTRAYTVRAIKLRKMRRAMCKYEELTMCKHEEFTMYKYEELTMYKYEELTMYKYKEIKKQRNC